MPASAYIFGLCILQPMCSLGCTVILPFIIMYWPFFVFIVVPPFILQVPSVMHLVLSLIVMFLDMGTILLLFTIILPSFIVQHSSEALATGLAVLGLVV